MSQCCGRCGHPEDEHDRFGVCKGEHDGEAGQCDCPCFERRVQQGTMSLPVEWVCDGLCRKEKTDDFDDPVIRVATLRGWLAKAKQESENGLSPDAAFGYRQAVKDLLAQLLEEGRMK